jgi:hypothetical protein
MSVQDHPNFSNIQTLVDSVVTRLAAKQADFFIAKARYFQGIMIPSTPTNGITLVSANVDVHPVGNSDNWFDFDKTTFPKNLKMFINLRTEAYKAPGGHGHVLIFQFWYSGLGPDLYGELGDHWQYVHHIGLGTTIYEPYDVWYIVPLK